MEISTYSTLAKEGPLWNVGPPPILAQFPAKVQSSL